MNDIISFIWISICAFVQLIISNYNLANDVAVCVWPCARQLTDS